MFANANTASPTIYWVVNDHLGRPIQMRDGSRAVAWESTYKPFGEVVSVTGPASLDARFPGQWFQLEGGLAYNWHRHYDASIGRYKQPDPLGFVDGPGVHGYVRQNPLGGVDPEGRFAFAAPAIPAVASWLSCGLGFVGGIALGHELFNQEPKQERTDFPRPYKGQTPDDKTMIDVKGSSAVQDPDNGSVWEKDRTKHGGSKWKRWPDRKSWEKNRGRESVRPDGSTR